MSLTVAILVLPTVSSVLNSASPLPSIRFNPFSSSCSTCNQYCKGNDIVLSQGSVSAQPSPTQPDGRGAYKLPVEGNNGLHYVVNLGYRSSCCFELMDDICVWSLKYSKILCYLFCQSLKINKTAQKYNKALLIETSHITKAKTNSTFLQTAYTIYMYTGNLTILIELLNFKLAI